MVHICSRQCSATPPLCATPAQLSQLMAKVYAARLSELWLPSQPMRLRKVSVKRNRRNRLIIYSRSMRCHLRPRMSCTSTKSSCILLQTTRAVIAARIANSRRRGASRLRVPRHRRSSRRIARNSSLLNQHRYRSTGRKPENAVAKHYSHISELDLFSGNNECVNSPRSRLPISPEWLVIEM
jgi:hypothetical protein